MEELSPHLSHFQPHLRFLFVFTISMSWLASSCGACKEEIFKCGDHILGYPFGWKNSGCGDPALQLDCDHEVEKPLINISANQYYILTPQILYPEHSNLQGIMRIKDKHLDEGGSCNPYQSNYTDFLSSAQFHSGRRYNLNLTLWQNCDETIISSLNDIASFTLSNNNWYYCLNRGCNLNATCKSKVILPISLGTPIPQNICVSLIQINAGFQITWTASEDCRDCDSNGGHCACHKSSMQFCCECSEKRCANKCPAGVTIGTIALLLIGVLLVIVHRKRSVSSSSGKNLQLSNVEKFLQDYAHQMPSIYSYPQLKKITNNFAHKLGEGGFGMVYRGKLPSGNVVAVKMLDRSWHSDNQLMKEVPTIGRIYHVHFVRLMGYCYEGIIRALVYEYLPNGSLEKFTFLEREVLSWEQLCSMALGAARGIAYLHDDCNRRIIHFDIKPHNILLVTDFTQKVPDFGVGKLCGKKDDHISMTAHARVCCARALVQN